MTQKPSQRPIWFWPLLGFLIPVGVGGIFLFFQWLQWGGSSQKQQLANEKTEQIATDPSESQDIDAALKKYESAGDFKNYHRLAAEKQKREVEDLEKQLNEKKREAKNQGREGEFIDPVLQAKLEAGKQLLLVFQAGAQGLDSPAFARLDRKGKDYLREQKEIADKIKSLREIQATYAPRSGTAGEAASNGSDSNYVSPPSDNAPPATDNLNSDVSDQLNMADGLFKEGLDGCQNVSAAIMAANNPEAFGPTSESQKAELRGYAQRCGLRF